MIVTKLSHSSKSLPGLLEGLKKSLSFHPLPLEEHHRLDFLRGFEIHGDPEQGVGGNLN